MAAAQYDFVTFDATRKHLGRVVAPTSNPAEAARAKPERAVNVNTVLLTVSQRRTKVSKPISFEEFIRGKRNRPVQVCFKCGKQKEIYSHLNGEEDKPLCNACNMQLRRNSPGAIQVKLLKLCATAIGSVEAMLGLPVEEKQKKTLQDMQDELKLMVRVWLGDTQADEESNATTATEQIAELPQVAPTTKIILFSAHDVPASVWSRCADAFVSKLAFGNELVAMIERIVNQTLKNAMHSDASTAAE